MAITNEAIKTIELATRLVESYPVYPTTFSTCSSCKIKPAKGGMEGSVAKFAKLNDNLFFSGIENLDDQF